MSHQPTPYMEILRKLANAAFSAGRNPNISFERWWKDRLNPRKRNG